MINSKAARLTTTAFACLALQGCGSDGGGSVASTPPPAGVNTSLLGPLKSETFANDAAQVALSVGTLADTNAKASAATATFAYDADRMAYTVAVAGMSKTFGSSSIDASQSNTEITTYVLKSGETTDTLTLTKAGTSGHDTYQYVGGALWQSITITSPNIGGGDGNIYAVTYGEPTAASAVPTSGTASYGIDLIGAASTGTADFAGRLTGSGNVTVNFANGALALSGFATSASFSGGGSFSGGANLSSSGSFTGAISLESISTTSAGQMTGRLYGPNAQEIGATFTLNGISDGSVGAYEYAASGVIIGRSQTAPAADTSFVSLSGTNLLDADHTSQIANTAATIGTASVGLLDYENELSVVFVAPGVSSAQGAVNLPYSNAYHETSVGYALGTGATGSGVILYDDTQTQYVRSGTYYDKTNFNPNYDQFTFGFETPDTAVPRTGNAGFATVVDGILTPPSNATAATEISGNGQIAINFATGAVTTNASLQNSAVSETLSGTGAMSSTANTFSGTLSLAGTTAYTGSWQGRLYGPAATEIGAVFAATDTQNGNVTGTMVGVSDPTIANPAATLSALGQSAAFFTAESSYASGIPVLPAQQATTYANVTQITYDPATRTYIVTPITTPNNSGQSATAPYSGQLSATAPVTLTPADVIAAQSDATFTAYVTPTTTGRIFNSGPTNPVIQLSYVSFAELTQQATYSAYSYPDDHFQVFGLETPASAVPTTGSGSYSGVVYGRGNIASLGTGDQSIGGSGQLSANFAAGTWSSTLNLNATPAGGGTAIAIGSISYSGPIQGSSITSTSNPTLGQMFGKFYGPSANEVGAAWSYTGPNGPASTSSPYLNSLTGAGVFVGKKS